MADNEKPVEKVVMASLSAAITSQDSVNNNLVTIMAYSKASDQYFDEAIIHDLKHRLRDYVHLATPHKILTSGGVLLDGTTEGVLQGLVTDYYGNQILVRVDIMVASRIGYNLFSVTTAAKKGIVTILDYENPRLEGNNVTVPLRSESGVLYSFVLDFSEDGYGTKELAMNVVTNTGVAPAAG